MLNKSSDGLFDISKFDIEGNNYIGVSLSVTDTKAITLIDIARAVADCYSDYDVNTRKLAPTIYFKVMTNNTRTYEFKVNWELDFEDYVVAIAGQIKL